MVFLLILLVVLVMAQIQVENLILTQLLLGFLMENRETVKMVKKQKTQEK